MIPYIKAVTLKTDASSKITNFQRDLFLKSIPFLKMKTLNFVFYIIDDGVCDQLLPYLKLNPKKCLTT